MAKRKWIAVSVKNLAEFELNLLYKSNFINIDFISDTGESVRYHIRRRSPVFRKIYLEKDAYQTNIFEETSSGKTINTKE